MDLQLQNKALLIKFLAKFYNNADVPWVALIRDSYYYHTVPHAVVKSGSFWWRGVLGLAHEWCKLATCQVGNGHSTLFWEDNWFGQVLPEQFPRLFSYAKNQMISVHDLMSSSQILDEFHLPLSVQAFHEFNEVQGILAGVFLEDEADMWIFSSNKGVYTSNSFYRLQFSHLENHIPSCWIWKSRCMSKHRFSAWLLLHDRFNTKDMIGRRNWKLQDNNQDCVLCQQAILKDRIHMFFQCHFSTRVWNYLQIQWMDEIVIQNLKLAKQSFDGPCFSEIVILACWNIWKQRNGWIFNNVPASFRGWKASFIVDITMFKHRVKANLVTRLSSWIDNLL